MAQQQKKKTEKKSAGTPAVKPVRKPFSGLTSLDENKKKILRKVVGLVLGAFAVFTFLAVFSYLFTLSYFAAGRKWPLTWPHAAV